jgi:DNA-directed RNA polymerase specialized sigma24 family protein
VRRKGHQPDDAADLVQGFFVSLLERGAIAAADPERGRFRAFLLASLDHHISNQRRHDHALKRGGGETVLGLDFSDGERRYTLEPAHDLTPDRVFDQRWALALIDAAMVHVRGEYDARGKAALFDALSPLLGGDHADTYAKLAAQLSMTEGALKVAVHRLRQRCRELVRQEVAQTVADPAEIDEELRHLFGAV